MLNSIECWSQVKWVTKLNFCKLKQIYNPDIKIIKKGRFCYPFMHKRSPKMALNIQVTGFGTCFGTCLEGHKFKNWKRLEHNIKWDERPTLA